MDNTIKPYKQPTTKIEKLTTYCSHYGVFKTAKKLVKKALGKDQEHYQYRRFLAAHPLSEAELEAQRNRQFDKKVLISIVIPLYNTNHAFLKELIESFLNQTYPNWELCLADGSPKEGLEAVILGCCAGTMDKRIRYSYLGTNGGISENTNAALKLATGDFIGFCDHDDLITVDAMYHIAEAINSDETIDCIYSDEDKINMEGTEYFLPHFKSDFNIDLLCSHNYITHLFVVKSSLLMQVGAIKSEYDGAQDHDFDLRVVEQAQHIYHIPRVLYHWRCHSDSTADHPEAKMYAYDSGRRAVEDHYKRLNIPAHVELDTHLGYYRTKFDWPDEPMLSIIIPNRNHMQDLKECIDSITEKNLYKNIEFVIVENGSTDKALFQYYEKLEKRQDYSFKVIDYACHTSKDVNIFNYSKLVNLGVKHSNGEYILHLNNDTRMINPDSISEMMGFIRREDVGAVGARLYYGNNTVQHAGLIIGLGGVANSQFLGSGREQVGYFYRSTCVQDVSAVTGACLLTKRTLYNQVNGFDEELAVAFNDVDYCLKLRKCGYLIIYDAFSEWYHLESVSRGLDADDSSKAKRLADETAIFEKKWYSLLEKTDEYYNPNLSKTKFDYSFDF